MPRRARQTPGGYAYHALNRATARLKLFRKAADYAAFLRVLDEALEQHSPARLGLLHLAHPLASRPLARRRWGADFVLALVDPDAFSPLAQTLPQHGQRPRVPESLQGICGRRGRTPFDRASLRRAQSAAGWVGAAGRGLALVQPGMPVDGR